MGRKILFITTDEQRFDAVGCYGGKVIVIATITALAMTRIGFVFAAVPGLAVFCRAFGYRRFVTLAIISVAVPVCIWALFTFGFELLLPRSPWFYQI